MEFIFIKNYKAIKLLKIEKLSRINVFTGRNNTSKSSILEAISLIASRGSLKWIKIILEERGENIDQTMYDFNATLKLLTSLFNNREVKVDYDNEIGINDEHNIFKLRHVYILKEIFKELNTNGKEVVNIKKTIVDDKSQQHNDLEFELSFNGKTRLLDPGLDIFKNNGFSEEINPLHFINSSGKTLVDSASLWDKITLTEKEVSVVEALRIIEPKIQRLSFVSDEYSNSKRYPVVKIEGSKEVLALQSMGDGINRILKVILAAVNCENGTLLIDEFENGLHHSVQQKLWEVIFSISKKLNIQVFVTTHSEDAIHAFAKVLEEDETNEGSLYRLAYRNDNLTANLFTEEEIKNAAKFNIELR